MSRMYHTLNDVSKFLNLSSDLTLRRKGKLQKFLRTLKNKDFFTKEEYYNMYPCSSQSVRIYATPKAHKLKSLIDAFIVINWRSFWQIWWIQFIQLSIPLKRTIDIAVNLIFDKYPYLKTTRQLKKLYEFAASWTHFHFDGNYYDQIGGVAMGSPLGLVLANQIMGFHEKRWLSILWYMTMPPTCQWFYLLAQFWTRCRWIYLDLSIFNILISENVHSGIQFNNKQNK